MFAVAVFPYGGFLSEHGRTLRPSPASMADIRPASDGRAPNVDRDGPVTSRSGMNPPDPYADEPKWPAWKVTVFVIVFCGAFWAGVLYLLSRLFG